MSAVIPSVIKLKVITPVRLLVEREVDFVGLPSLEGELGILPGHAPFFIGLGKGKLTYRAGDRSESFFVRGGYAQVQPEEVVVMTEAGGDESGEEAA
jgi:F-type H+-transporting ATPase subunit epsilon